MLYLPRGERRPSAGPLVAAIVFVYAIAFSASAVHAQDGRAEQLLKAMSDYLAGVRNLSVTFDTDIEIITPELQKIQFTSSGRVLLSRPDKLRASRRGGYADVEFVFDGKTLTIHGKNLDAYAQLESPGSTDQLVDRLRDEFHMEAPGASFLVSDPYDELMQDVFDASYIGNGVIDGIDTEHLAFRGHETDWQIWIETGPRPIPRKFVITSKAVTGAPQYTLRIKEWNTEPQVGADAFVFTPTAGAARVEPHAMPHIDEVPPGVVRGEQQ